MFGTGPFITLPLMVVTMHGPRSFFGYALATLLTVCDGMVWAELGTLFPQAGGTYEYLLEAFGRHRWGKFFSFLFIWQFLLSAPLEIASGYVG
jgi:amino acid transporter